MADVGSTRLAPPINACPDAVAEVGQLLGTVGTGLGLALGDIAPQATRTRAVTATILAASGFCLAAAIGQRVESGGNELASTRTVARFAQTALILRVRIVGVELADTFLAGHDARSARRRTPTVAAHAIDTDAAQALGTGAARISKVLLRLADAAGVAIVARRALVIVSTRGVTFVAVAAIRQTRGSAPVRAASRTIALVFEMHGVGQAVLQLAGRARNPQAAVAGAVAGTVEAAILLSREGALPLRIFTRTHVCTRTRAVTNPALAAVVLRIQTVGVWGADTRIQGT